MTQRYETHIELKDLNNQSSPSATLVGTPSSFQHSESYFEMESPVKDQNFNELTITATSDSLEYPYHVTYKGHEVTIDSTDFKKSVRLRFQIAVAFMFLIFNGLNDQSIGTLLPRIVDYYQVDHSVVSYVFIAGFLGSLCAAMMNDFLHRSIGIIGMLSLACFLWSLCSFIASFGPPLWLLITGYLFYGFAGGCSNGVLNIWAGKLVYHNQIMGFLHASYGVGCMITPIVATYLLEHGMDWRQWYYVLIAVAGCILACSYAAFNKETKWKYMYLMENEPQGHDEDIEMTLDQDTTVETNEVSFSKIARNKFVWFFCTTLFFYLGGEASVGNWVYNYLIIIKKLSPSDSSYITSAYWLALTLGRGFIGLIIGKFFENNETTIAFIVCVLISISTAFFTISSSMFVQTVSICAVGAFVGPVFPTTIIIALKTLPMSYHAMGVGFISSCGSSGAALVPYIIGYVSAMNKDSPDYVEGEGLVYFPIISLGVFGIAMVMWGGFFLYQQKNKKIKLQRGTEQGSSVTYERL